MDYEIKTQMKCLQQHSNRNDNLIILNFGLCTDYLMKCWHLDQSAYLDIFQSWTNNDK